MFLSVVAVAWSVATVTAMPAPIAAFVPSACPSALVVVLPLLSAATVKLPLRVSVSPLPTLAIAWLSAMLMPTTGVTEMFPAEPAFASVVIL